MIGKSEDPLDQLMNRILSRLNSQDRSDLGSLLRNVAILIKRIEKKPLNEKEKTASAHPLFSHIKQQVGQNTAEALLYRLQLIDRYQLNIKQHIIEILTKNIPIATEARLSTRKAQILWQLFQDPTIPKYHLAKKAGTTPRTLSKDLAELERDYSLQIFTAVDPHKFHLVMLIIIFETKSIKHIKILENYIATQPGFLRLYQIDQDMRRGIILYRYPNQPNGHEIFENRIKWLEEEIFEESYRTQALGIQQSLSFEMYNPATHSFSIEPEIVSQVPFDYSKSSLDTLPQPRGFDFTEPLHFDQADFLLADTLYSSKPFAHVEYKQHLLARHGINYSKKTIWKKQQRLRKEKAGFPMIELQIPGFDDDMALFVFCTPKATSAIRAVSAFLPYIMFVNTSSGCLLRIQRPIHTSSLTGQLIRKIHRQDGVTDVKLLRYQQRFKTPLLSAIVDKWNTEEQRWNIEEGDI